MGPCGLMDEEDVVGGGLWCWKMTQLFKVMKIFIYTPLMTTDISTILF